MGAYLDRIRAIAVATGPSDHVFTDTLGNPAPGLYARQVRRLLTEAGLREGRNGVPRSSYSFRHTYAMRRLSEDVGIYLLAVQMGTTVAFLEEYYGHAIAIRDADRILRGVRKSMLAWGEHDGA